LFALADQAAEGEARRLKNKAFLLLFEQRKQGATLTMKDVEKLLGRPEQVSRQILYRRYLEQWLYPSGRLSVLVDFDCRKGQEPYVLTVHPLSEGKP
jgi:hypothetical protein